MRQPLPVDVVDVVGRTWRLADERSLGDARLAHRHSARRLVRLDGEHGRSSADQVIGRPHRLTVRHLAVVPQTQFLADVPLDRQPRPEPGAWQLPRPRPVLAVAAARLLSASRSTE